MGSWGSIYNHTRWALRTQLSELARLQEQVTSGSRVNRASDDPIAARRIMKLQSQAGQYASFTSNIESLETTLGDADNALQGISGLLTEVRGKLTQAATGTLSDTQRKGIAEGINQALETVVTLANHRSLGRYIFAGTAVDQPPYEVVRSNGQIVSVSYRGNYEDLPVSLAQGVQQSSLQVGERIFRSSNRQAPQMTGSTGAAAGTATPNATGDVWLEVAHGTTTYAGGIGLAGGTSTSSDTIIGTHQLTVDADARTLTLDNGSTVSFNPADTNVRVTNSDGEVLNVDVSGLLLGAGSQTVEVSATARLSIDDGATWTNADLSETNLKVVDSRDGTFLYVDTRSIRQKGTEPVRVEGTYDLFGTLITIRDLIANSRSMSTQEQLNALSEAVGSLDEVSGGLAQQLVVVGSRLQAAESLRTSIETLTDSIEIEIAHQESADITDLATQLTRTQTLYQMTLAATSKLLGLSLLDYV